MTLIIFLFLGVCIYNAKICKNNFYCENYLTISENNSIRGILATLILICHTLYFLKFQYSGRLSNIILKLFLNSGYLAVGIFLLFSGYGLMYGLINKQNYLNGFLHKRLPKIIIPFIITNILYIIVKSNTGIAFSFKEIILSFFTVKIMPNAWYIITIIIFYIIFYLFFHYFELKKSIIYLMCFQILYIILCYVFKLGEYWYVSSIPFVLGVVLGANKLEIIKKCQRNYVYFIVISFFCFLLFYDLTSLLKVFNIYINETVSIIGRVQKIVASTSFSIFFCFTNDENKIWK